MSGVFDNTASWDDVSRQDMVAAMKLMMARAASPGGGSNWFEYTDRQARSWVDAVKGLSSYHHRAQDEESVSEEDPEDQYVSFLQGLSDHRTRAESLKGVHDAMDDPDATREIVFEYGHLIGNTGNDPRRARDKIVEQVKLHLLKLEPDVDDRLELLRRVAQNCVDINLSPAKTERRLLEDVCDRIQYGMHYCAHWSEIPHVNMGTEDIVESIKRLAENYSPELAQRTARDLSTGDRNFFVYNCITPDRNHVPTVCAEWTTEQGSYRSKSIPLQPASRVRDIDHQPLNVRTTPSSDGFTDPVEDLRDHLLEQNDLGTVIGELQRLFRPLVEKYPQMKSQAAIWNTVSEQGQDVDRDRLSEILKQEICQMVHEQNSEQATASITDVLKGFLRGPTAQETWRAIHGVLQSKEIITLFQAELASYNENDQAQILGFLIAETGGSQTKENLAKTLSWHLSPAFVDTLRDRLCFTSDGETPGNWRYAGITEEQALVMQWLRSRPAYGKNLRPHTNFRMYVRDVDSDEPHVPLYWVDPDGTYGEVTTEGDQPSGKMNKR